MSVSPLVMTETCRAASSVFDSDEIFCHAADRDVDLRAARSSMAVSKWKKEAQR
jgi:hypothetical protein